MEHVRIAIVSHGLAFAGALTHPSNFDVVKSLIVVDSEEAATVNHKRIFQRKLKGVPISECGGFRWGCVSYLRLWRSGGIVISIRLWLIFCI